MVRSPSVDKNGIKKGAWSEEEDNILRAYVERYGHWNWRQLPKFAGLARCGKSCRLRWLNYLKPGLKKGVYSKEEEDLIVKLREELGNKWSVIALQLPGRTDNEIKNHWHTHLQKRTKQDLNKPSKSTSTVEEKSFSSDATASDDNSSSLQTNGSFWSESFLLDKSDTAMVSPSSGSCNSTLLNTLASSKTVAKSFLEEVPLTLDDYKVHENTLIPTAIFADFQTDPFLIEASNSEVFPEDYEELYQILSSSSSEDEGYNYLPFSPSAHDGYDLMDRFFA